MSIDTSNIYYCIPKRLFTEEFEHVEYGSGGRGYEEGRIFLVEAESVIWDSNSILWPVHSRPGIYAHACKKANEAQIRAYFKYGDHIYKPSIEERMKYLKI